jgi:hypothetical protein
MNLVRGNDIIASAVLLLFAAGDVYAQIVPFPVWGAPDAGDSAIGHIRATGAGGLWIAGTTHGNFLSPSYGESDVFLYRWTFLPSGHFHTPCAIQFGSARDDWAKGLASDGWNAYIAGLTRGALPGKESLGGPLDAFVSKFDQTCTHLWTRQFGSALNDQAAGVAVDSSGVYVVGRSEVSSAKTRGFLRKFDVNGALLWAKFIESTGKCVSADAVGRGCNGHLRRWNG